MKKLFAPALRNMRACNVNMADLFIMTLQLGAIWLVFGLLIMIAGGAA